MGLATIHTNFFGICTHMDRSLMGSFPFAGPSVEYRVVLINATNPDTIHNSRLHGRDIQPHIPKLQIRIADIKSMTDVTTNGFTPDVRRDDDVISWRLDNVILSLANTLPGPRALMASDLPHLADLCQNLGLASEALTSLTVTPTGAAAYFDFFSGSVECRSFGVEGNAACVGRVTCTTVGDPQLRIRSFDPNVADIISIVLEPDTVLSVSNIPEDPFQDGPDDFLLHFLNAAKFPEGPQTPGGCTCPQLFDHVPTPKRDNLPIDASPFTTTPSCSNSTYP